MAYEKVVIGVGLGENENDLGKPITFLGRLDNKEDIQLWADRREIVLAIGKSPKNGDSYYIGEIRKDGEGWKWVWGIPIEHIFGYEDFVSEVMKKGAADGR